MADVSDEAFLLDPREIVERFGLDPEVDASTLFVTASAQRLAATNPFGDRPCICVDLFAEVNVAQLAEEIGELAGFEVQLSAISPQPGTPLSRSNPAKLYVHPQIGEAVITQAVNSHRIDPMYGFTQDQRDRAELVRKLHQGQDLSQDEMRQALRLALASG